MDSKSLWGRIAWRLIVNWLIIICLGIILHQLSPAPQTANIALGVLAAILGLLAAGIFTAYSSLSVADAPPLYIGFYNAGRQGCKRILLEVAFVNEVGMAFFSNHSFRRVRSLQGYYGEGLSAVRMGLDIDWKSELLRFGERRNAGS